MNRTLLAEWAPQSGVMLTWPHGHGDWRPFLTQVEPVFIDIGRAVTQFEKLLIATYDDAHRQHVLQRLAAAGANMDRVKTFIVPSNDTWARDHGPITVLEDNKPVLLDFVFNGWGNKFDAALDNKISASLYAQGAFGSVPLRTFPFVLEGGSIESDGKGTMLTTAHCLMSPERNPDMNRADIESHLADVFGLKRFLWLEHGYLAGDDTDSHIDTLARLCDENTIAYVKCDDPADEHFLALNAMEEELKAFRTLDGAPYKLVPLPWPKPIFDDNGKRLPATYANFLIINGAVLAPTYDDANDAAALQALAGCFPGREIIAVPCAPLVMQYGSLHCVTMQLPESVM